jgi:TIR domain-containing protein
MDWERLKALQGAAEKHRQVQDLLDLFGDHWHIKRQIEAARSVDYWQLQAQMDAARQYDLFRRRIEDATFAPLLPELLALKFETAEWRAATRFAAERLQSEIGAIEEKFRALSRPIAQVFEQAEVWKRQVSGVLNDQFKAAAVTQALNAGAVWRGEIERLITLIESRRVNTRFPELASRLFRPAEYFTDYARGLTERLNETEIEDSRAMLRGALVLAEEEFSSFVSLTESLVQSDSDIEDVEPGPPIVCTLYEEREKELVRLFGSDGTSRTESVEDIFDGLRTREIVGMTVDVLYLVGTCNKESRIRRGEDIFRHTNAVFAATALMRLVVKDEDGLGGFLIHLYKLLYEGAGGGAPRFVMEHGGYLEREDCNIIWTLKTLRDKFTADPEHGSEAEVRKSYSELGIALRSLGWKRWPVREEEFLTLQKVILSQSRDFLSLLLTKMQTSDEAIIEFAAAAEEVQTMSETRNNIAPDTSKTSRPIEIFYSYSHVDEDFRNELDKHLSVLKRRGVIAGWHDRKIAPGAEWGVEIDKHLEASNVILLLVSADFLASDYCYDKEMGRAMERHAQGAARVIPIILRSCDWQSVPFGKLQALPKDGKAITSWGNRDEAFTNVVEGLKRAIAEMTGVL